jgi:WD40 repeat protein
VALLENDSIRVPVTVGWFRALILLPSTWRAFSDDQRDAALLHELAHIRRADYPWQLLFRLVQVLYWFHPLTWVVGSFMTRVRERACDDLCVYWMHSARSYRGAPLDMALALARRRQAAPGLAMVRSARLGRRLADIDQSSGSSHCLARWPVRAAVTPLVLGAITLLGAAQPGPSPAPAQAALSPESTPSPAKPANWNTLEGARIPVHELKTAGGGDPAKAPAQLVAVLGDSRFKHCSGVVSQIAFSPDGKLLASAGWDLDGTLLLWDARTGEEHGRFRARSPGPTSFKAPCCVAFSPDGRTVAAGGFDSQMVAIWEVATGREIATLRCDSPVGYLAFHPGGRILATGQDREAKLWDLTTGKLLYALVAHANEFRPQSRIDHAVVAFTPDGDTLLVGHPDKTVRYWDVKTGKLLKTIEAHDGPVMALAVSRDGKYLATGSQDKTVSLWDLKSGRLLHTWLAHDHHVQTVAFHPDGKPLVTGGLDGMIKYWDVETGERKQSFRGSQLAGVNCLAFSPNGTTLASAGLAVRLWDAATGQPRLAFPGQLGAVESVAVSGDGQTVATAGSDGTVRVWDPLTQRLRTTVPATQSGLAAIAISPDGKVIASIDSYKGQVQLWDLASGQRCQSFQAEGDLRGGVAFSPDGNWLAAKAQSMGPFGDTITIWDGRRQKLHGRISTGSGSLFFSPDSKKLIVAGQTNLGPGAKSILQTWDLATLKLDTER